MTLDVVTLAVVAIVFVATLTRCTFGFGDALIAMPLLSMVVDIKFATPLVALCSITIAAAVTLQDWRKIRLKSAWPLAISSIVGIPLGLIYLTTIDETIVKLVLAVLLLGFSAYSLCNPSLQLNSDRWAVPFGFFAGMLGGAYNTQGPLIVIYASLRKWTPEEFRATMQGYFLPTGIVLLAGHYRAGLWAPPVFQYLAWCFPFVVLSVLIGGALNRRLNAARFAKLVYGLLVAIALLLLVNCARTLFESEQPTHRISNAIS